MMPSGSGVARLASDRPPSGRPALAKAKTGMMNQADHGLITCSSRMAGRASSASPADLRGMNSASTTPASVACTPDFSTDTHSSAPSSR